MVTETAQKVLEERYFLPGETSWSDLSKRVSQHFGKDTREKNLFNSLMMSMDFLPNSPTLMNAGTNIESYSACFVLPIEDTMESIYKFYKDAALISKSGGGVGANYSKIRGKSSKVSSTDGVASGPLSFMEVQDKSTEIIKQGGRRRGANMGILNCDHPDFDDFLHAKEVDGVLKNFNLSAGLTDEFMGSLDSNSQYGDKVRRQWDTICEKAWGGAEPGVIFLDTIEAGNKTPSLGRLDTTNPCGEQPLLPYESCTLGSINLSNMVTVEEYLPEGSRAVAYKAAVNDDKLKEVVHASVLFLNRILDNSKFPIPECQEAMEKTRKIGLGIMGLHDMLIQLGLSYDSEEARQTAGEVMHFIANEAYLASYNLGVKEGFAPALAGRRNTCLTTIAPTGTLSMIADCSGGCEPYYSPMTIKTVLDGTSFSMPNKWVEKTATTLGVSVEDVLESHFDLFKGASDISPINHVKMQAALQPHVDASISKTINMPSTATVEDVKEVYELAYKLKCKGVTVYRNGSREGQVLKDVSMETEDTPAEIFDFNLIKLDLPDVLDAKRYRIKDKDGKKGYLIICFDEENVPMEIFHKQPFMQNDVLWTTVCRSVSLSLRYGIPMQDIVKQLEKSSGSLTDLPSQLAKILKTYLSEEVGWTSSCPECTEGQMVYQSGCECCNSCGYSKCA